MYAFNRNITMFEIRDCFFELGAPKLSTNDNKLFLSNLGAQVVTFLIVELFEVMDKQQ